MIGSITLKNKNLRQFLSYVIVGGVATVVEWGLFWLFTYPLKLNQNLSFTIAFVFSTLVNMLLGKKMTFKNSSVINKSDSNTINVIKETVLIYLVAVIGYVFNILLLNFFTGSFHLNAMGAKMIATGIVFFWNYLARRLGIYRDNGKPSDIPA
jgi:putative flippase GtrA